MCLTGKLTLSTREKVKLSSKSHWMVYRTRVVSTAEKVNLKFADARPVLVSQVSHSVANIL